MDVCLSINVWRQGPRTPQREPASMMRTAGIWMKSRFRSKSSSSCPKEDTTARASSSTCSSARSGGQHPHIYVQNTDTSATLYVPYSQDNISLNILNQRYFPKQKGNGVEELLAQKLTPYTLCIQLGLRGVCLCVCPCCLVLPQQGDGSINKLLTM